MQDSLNADRRAELRRDLEQLRASLEAQLGDATDSSRAPELDQSRMGRVSRIDAIQQQQMAAAGLRRAEARLERVRAAIQRCEEDPESYGICPFCEEEIHFRRLKAFPDIVQCVACASRG
jgi:DnaK suppressor protein